MPRVGSLSPESLQPPETPDRVVEKKKKLKRLNTKSSGLAAGTSVINSSLFVQNVAQLKKICDRQRKCENFCAIGPAEIDCETKLKNVTQNSLLPSELDCDFERMNFLTAIIICSVILQVVYGLITILDVAVGEKTLGASVTSANPKKRAKAKTIMVLNMSLAFVISILNFLIAGFE